MLGIKTPIYLSEQIRECEALAEQRFGMTRLTLMQRAGKAAFDYMARRWPQAQKIAVFCGGGNNGGDGYVLAEEAHERGLKVIVFQVGNHQTLSAEAKAAFESCVKANVAIQVYSASAELGRPDLVVDAICGIGLKDKLREEEAKLVDRIESLMVPIFSLDVPSGVDADTGNVPGTAIHAAATMTFIGLKLGLLTGKATSHTGEVVSHDLQLPAELFSHVQPIAKKLHLSAFSLFLNPRARDWHKGLSGHVLIVGGAPGFAGAVQIAAEAALRVGAGLVSVATMPEHAEYINTRCPEVMSHGVSTAKQLAPLMAKASVVVLGPGLGQSAWSKMLWEQVCASELPKVVDADGLNLLAETTLYHDGWVLTPHPGEAGRLLGVKTEEIQQDRLKAVKALHERYGGVCVLKGAGTLVYSPDKLTAVCDKGNPGMATAGMGDLLSGVIAGLIAQGMSLTIAAKLGVLVHALAGDLAAKEGERGLLATDLLPFLRRLVNRQP